MKNNSFLTSLSKNLIRDVQQLMAGNSSVGTPLEDLGEAAKTLTAKQKKIDKNHNGKLDADDFRRLRAEGIDRVVIHSPHTPDIHGGLAEVTHRDRRNGDIHIVFENMKYTLKKGQFKELPEEFEQLDELSKATLSSYIKKAVPSMKALDDSSDRHHQKGHDTYKAGATKTSDAHFKLADKQHKKALNRAAGINKAADRLTKEEVELDEIFGDEAGKLIDKARKKFPDKTHPVHAHIGNLIDAIGTGRGDANKHADSIRKHLDESVELTQEELDRIEALMADLEEGRGRPPKEGSEAWKRKQEMGAAEQDEPRQHPIQQLERIKHDMRGANEFKHKNGEVTKLTGAHASTLLAKYQGLKPAGKEEMQKEIHASAAGLKKHL